MRINKLIIAGVVITLVILLIGVFASIKKGGPQNIPSKLAPTPPVFQGHPTTGPLVIFSLASGFALPAVENWEQYAVSTQDYKALATNIVNRLTTKSSQITTTMGEDEITTWSWSGGEASLSISGGAIASFTFTDSSRSSGGISINALSEALELPPDFTISPVSPPTQASGSINFPYDPSLGQVFRSTHSLVYKGYPVLLAGPSEQSIIMFTEASGRIRNLSILLPIQNPKTLKKVTPIKTSDVLRNLNQNRGLFVTSDINGVWENDDPLLFNRATIKSGKPARLLNRNTMTLEPVFILDGEGETTTGKKTIRYILTGYSE